MAVVCQQCGNSYEPTAEFPRCPTCSTAARKRSTSPSSATAARPAAQRRVVQKSSSAQEPVAARPASRPAARESAARPAAKPAAPSAQQRASRPAPHAHHAPREKPLLDNATRYGLFATVGLGVIVGLVCLVVFRSKAREQARFDAYNAEVNQIYKSLQALETSDPATAERLIQEAADKKDTWQHHELASDIELVLSRARNKLTSAKEKHEAQARFDEIEAALAKGDSTSDRLKEIRLQLDESEAVLGGGDAEIVARIAMARTKSQQQYATRLVEEARAGAKDATTPRASLVRYQTVEDELKSLLDRAFTAKDQEQQDFYTNLYKQVIAESDTLANALFQAEGESMPWVDCLTPPQDKNWNASTARGFSHKVEDGTLLIVGSDPDAGKLAVISIGDREQWRHFQADMTFIIEKGDLDLFLRLGRGPNQNTINYRMLSTGTQGGLLVPGKRYAMRVSVIGSKLSVRFEDEDIDTPGATEMDIPWTYTRKGAIGFVVSPQARAKFTRFRVRELR